MKRLLPTNGYLLHVVFLEILWKNSPVSIIYDVSFLLTISAKGIPICYL